MKVLIWSICLFVVALITTLLNYAGVTLGAIGSVLLFYPAYKAATYFCGKWDEKRTAKKTEEAGAGERENIGIEVTPEPAINENRVSTTTEAKIEESETVTSGLEVDSDHSAAAVAAVKVEQPMAILQETSEEKVVPVSAEQLKKKTFPLIIMLAVSVAALVVSVVYILQQNAAFEELKKHDETLSKNYDILFKKYDTESRSLNSAISGLETKVRQMEDKLDFYNDSVVFVLDDGTNLFHRYKCPHWPTGSYSFWAYNPEAAISKGYHKCSYYDSGLVKN